MRVSILEPNIYEKANWNIFKKVTFTNDDCDVLCVGLQFTINDKLLSAFPSVKYIVSPTTGIDHIQTTKNVQIISLDSADIRNIRASSEFTFLLALNLIRKFNYLDSGSRKDLIGEELYQKTVGILGHGRIGSNLAGYAIAFGARILTHDINSATTKKEVLEKSDIIFVTISAKKENTNYIMHDEFDKMKRQPYFVNTSRAFIVNEVALLDALLHKKIKGAALDVIDDPNIFKNYIKTNNNLIITPHIAGSTIQSHEKACNYVLKKLKETL